LSYLITAYTDLIQGYQWYIVYSSSNLKLHFLH